jgi:periplasmic protein TonB
MAGLADSYVAEPSARVWLRRGGIAILLCGVVGLVAWAGLSMSHGPSSPARQVAKIALLPDEPPPPPPPPPPERPKLEPKEEIKQQIERPKTETPPEPEPIKMEGQAGDGPSPFAAGTVKNDYIGGDTGNGARYSAYVGRIAQLIQQQLARHNLRVESARVFLWLTPDGAIQRYQISGATPEVERSLRTAMTDLGQLPEAPPGDMPMPMGLEVSGR